MHLGNRRVPDLLVKLYALADPAADRPLPAGVMVRRALAPERAQVLEWVTKSFNERWASECAVAFSGHPVTTWIAVRDGAVIGFACADATAKGFFGPTGVAEAERGKGIGAALLLAALRGMREAGYGYAIIGSVGSAMDFYAKLCGATEIPDSSPGIYRHILPRR
jgi:GNAT superfamily N-acetyltransferase